MSEISITVYAPTEAEALVLLQARATAILGTDPIEILNIVGIQQEDSEDLMWTATAAKVNPLNPDFIMRQFGLGFRRGN